MRRFVLLILSCITCGAVFAQIATTVPPGKPTTGPGSPAQPVFVVNSKTDNFADASRHDGGLTPVIGVETIQAMRANRAHPEWADNFGFTYNHVPMLAYWDGRFYYEFNSNTYGEQVPPGHTMLVSSADGRNWDMPKEAFPIYFLDRPPFVNRTGEPGMAMTHGVMGFYSAPNGRHIVMTYYGINVLGQQKPDLGGEYIHFGASSIGRAVREVYKDGTFGPVYFLRYQEHYVDGTKEVPGWSEANTTFPFYKRSPDQGFIKACDDLLADPFKEMSWWEYEALKPYFAPGKRTEAPAIFHRKDGVAVSVWKLSFTSLSYDEGKSWTEIVKEPTIITAGAKVWGQKTTDGRYALVYNPTGAADGGYGAPRWPLAVVTSDDGITFDHMALIDGEIAPRRYMGKNKDFGLQYVRGIPEDDGKPPGNNMWVAYTTKEDIWVSRVPIPIRTSVDGPVSDNFDSSEPGGEIKDWNIRHGKWITADVVPFPSATNRSLQLGDKDPYDSAIAERVFHEGTTASISFKVYAHQSILGRMEIDVRDHTGHRPVRLAFGDDGHVWASDGAKRVDVGPYKSERWYAFELAVNAATGKYDLKLNDAAVVHQASFAEPASSVKRLSFRTGAYTTDPELKKNQNFEGRDLPNAGEPVPLAVYNIDDVTIRN